MIRSILWAGLVLVPVLLLQTTVLTATALWGVTAHWILVLFLILATQNGSQFGMVFGFLFGLLVDFLTMQPLGYHSFLFTVIGYLFGLGKGKIFFDPLFLPFLAGVVVTILEYVLRSLLNGVFQLGIIEPALLSVSTLVQLGLNGVACVIAFAVFSLLKSKIEGPRRGFYA